MRTGVLVVRAWKEGGDERLRARITYMVDLDHGVQVTRAAATPEDVEGAVRAWLAALLAPSS
jgi:hypothetical protein